MQSDEKKGQKPEDYMFTASPGWGFAQMKNSDESSIDSEKSRLRSRMQF